MFSCLDRLELQREVLIYLFAAIRQESFREHVTHSSGLEQCDADSRINGEGVMILSATVVQNAVYQTP